MERKYTLTVVGSEAGTEVTLNLTNEQKNWLNSVVAKVNQESKEINQPIMQLARKV